ncbi:MAG TPA: hypothetical protein VE526_17420 [Solirubrobacteraceae bacterium]|nr:hypothetical protein [Solirubrobacteraceae bacterium]
MDTEPDNIPEDVEEGEVVDGLPVLPHDAPPPEPLRPAPVPAVQAAALAATGFVAGAATVAVVAHRRGRVSRRRRRKKGVVGEIVGSNSFLVDVHLVRRG